MNGRTSRKIKEFALRKYNQLDERRKKILTPRRIYRALKRRYNEAGKNFNKMVLGVTG